MSIHGICYDEGQSGNCGIECEGFQDGKCDIPDEILLGYMEMYPDLVILRESGILNGSRRNEMSNTKTLASLMIEGLKTVKVKFKDYDKKFYTYKTLWDHEVGDFVVVRVQDEYKVVEVMEVDDVPDLNIHSDVNYKWIVDKVDIDHHKTILDTESEMSKELRRVEQKGVINKAREMMAEILGVEKSDVDAIVDKSK